MKVENLVCTGSFNQHMDLEGLSSSVGCIEFGKNRYPAAYIRSEKGFVTVYRTGRYIMQGITSLAEVDALYSEVKRLLSPFCDVGLFTTPTVRNMVCTSDAGRVLDLDMLFIRISMAGGDATFEPEVFPGLILRTERCTYNIFSTGRFIILGCKNEADALRSESWLLSILSDAERDILLDLVRRTFVGTEMRSAPAIYISKGMGRSSCTRARPDGNSGVPGVVYFHPFRSRDRRPFILPFPSMFMVLKPVTVKLDDKEIRYLDSLKGKGKISSRSSAVRAIVRDSMERTDLCRGSAWTEVNRSSKGRTAKNGSGGSAKVRAGPNITFEDVVVDNRISAGELKVAEDGRVLQADDETIKAMHQKRWFNPMKVVWTEYRPLYPDECPPGPYIHWRVRQSRATEPEPMSGKTDSEPQPRPVRRRRISDATLEFLRTRRSPARAAVMHRFRAVYGRTEVRGVGNRPEGRRRLYGRIQAPMCSTGFIVDMVHQASSETGGYQLVGEGRGRGSDVCSDDLASVSRGSENGLLSSSRLI